MITTYLSVTYDEWATADLNCRPPPCEDGSYAEPTSLNALRKSILRKKSPTSRNIKKHLDVSTFCGVSPKLIRVVYPHWNVNHWLTYRFDRPQSAAMTTKPDHDGTYRWYFTADVVRQWLHLTGRRDDDGGRNWGIAEQELGQLAEQARDTGKRTDSGAHIYRTKARVHGRTRTVRVEFTVMMDARPEGDLPQLLRVRTR